VGPVELFGEELGEAFDGAQRVTDFVGEGGGHFAQGGEVLEFELAAFGEGDAVGIADGEDGEADDEEAAEGDKPEVVAGVFDEEIGGGFGDIDAGDVEAVAVVEGDVGTEGGDGGGEGLGTEEFAAVPEGGERVGAAGTVEDGEAGEGFLFVGEDLLPLEFRDGGRNGFQVGGEGGDAGAEEDVALGVEFLIGANGAEDEERGAEDGERGEDDMQRTSAGRECHEGRLSFIVFAFAPELQGRRAAAPEGPALFVAEGEFLAGFGEFNGDGDEIDTGLGEAADDDGLAGLGIEIIGDEVADGAEADGGAAAAIDVDGDGRHVAGDEIDGGDGAADFLDLESGRLGEGEGAEERE
jgi:hypothetical protein